MFAAGDSEIFKPVAWRNLDVLMSPNNKLTAFTVVTIRSVGSTAASREGPSGTGDLCGGVLASFSLCMQFPWRQIPRPNRYNTLASETRTIRARDLTLLEYGRMYRPTAATSKEKNDN